MKKILFFLSAVVMLIIVCADKLLFYRPLIRECRSFECW